MANPHAVQATLVSLSLGPEMMYGNRPLKNMQVLLSSVCVFVCVCECVCNVK
jgi:hypothetical protein